MLLTEKPRTAGVGGLELDAIDVELPNGFGRDSIAGGRTGCVPKNLPAC